LAADEVEIHLTTSSQVPSLLAFPDTREGPGDPGAERKGTVRTTAPPRVLVGGVGYTCLGDLSVGPALIERLAGEHWPPGVVVEDLSYGPLDVLYRLQASSPFTAGVFVTAAVRGRTPGLVYREHWQRASLPADELQARIAEAVTGVISLDNLLYILSYFGALPPKVVVFEVEPLRETWGLEFSPPVQAALTEAETSVRSEVERLLQVERAG
jgi:hydrogenase maturation protease